MTRLAILVLLVGALTLQAQPANEPPGAFSVSMVGPPEWRFLQEQSVRAELKLSPAQIASAALLADWSNFHFAIRCVSLGCIPSAVIRDELPHAREVFVAKALTNEQGTRLRQIVFQLKEREFGAHAAFAMAARDLGLRPDQLEDVGTIKGQRVEAIAKLVTSGERFDKVKPKVDAAIGDTFENMAEMLTRTQRERLKEMRGTSLKLKDGVLEALRERIKLPETERSQSIYAPELFGSYDYEVRYLGNERYREALGITKEQLPTIQKARDSWNDDYSRAREKLGWLETLVSFHERTAKSIASMLTAEQLERFHQIMAQRRIAIGGIEAACGYPPVVDKLKLTPIQLTSLKEGKKITDVLSKTEIEALKTFLGRPSSLEPDDYYDPVIREIKQANADRLRRESDIDKQAALAEQKSEFARNFLIISDRLKLSEEQIKKLRELAEDEPKFFELIQRELSFADTPPVTGAGRGFTPAGAVADQFRAAVEEQCWKVLDERQQSLARQIFGRRQ